MIRVMVIVLWLDSHEGEDPQVVSRRRVTTPPVGGLSMTEYSQRLIRTPFCHMFGLKTHCPWPMRKRGMLLLVSRGGISKTADRSRERSPANTTRGKCQQSATCHT